MAQALGRSRGGFSTKVHASVDALGNPLRFILTAEEEHDIKQAEALIECLFNKAKQFRRVFSRYDKFAGTYPTNRGSAHLAEMKCPHSLVRRHHARRLRRVVQRRATSRAVPGTPSR